MTNSASPRIVDRRPSVKPPTFRKGAPVAFLCHEGVIVGTFVRRFSPAPRAGVHYEVEVDGKIERLFANGSVGRTLTAQN